MARGNYRDYLHGDTVWVKKYFYVLRPLLAILWIERGLGVVPTEFGKLVEATIDETGLRSAVDALIARKKSGDELDKGPRIPAISDFIAAELARLEHAHIPPREHAGEIETLNGVFREVVDTVWAG